jgi:hypothetical protein
MPTSQIIHSAHPLSDDPKLSKGRFSFKREGLEQTDPNHLGIAKLRDINLGSNIIVTQDGYQIREQEFQTQRTLINSDGTQTPIGNPRYSSKPAFYTDSMGANFAGQREVFGPGLINIKDKEQFLKQYKLNLRNTAFSALNTSEQEAKQKQRLFANEMPATEAPKIHKVATSLEAIDKQLAQAKSTSLWTDIGTGLSGVDLITGMPTTVNPAKYEAQSQAHKRVQQLEQQRAALLTQYPLLSRVNPADFNKLNPQEQAKALYEACGGVLTDIQTTRQNIIKDKLNLWQLAPLVATTTNGLGVQPEQMEWVAEKIKTDKTWDVASTVGMGVLSIGLAIGGTLLGGPLGAAMAWSAFGLGVGSAISETEQYFTNQAGANTSIDPNKSVVPQDMKGHWGWVAAAWVGAGLDLGAAVHATRLLKAGMEVDQVIKLLSTQKGLSAQELKAAYTTLNKSSSDPKTLKKLLQSALPENMAGQGDELLKSIKVLKPEEFTQKFGSESADAVTTFTKDKDGVVRAQVYFREGGNPLAMREEAVHISQLAEGGDIAKKAALLTEENLAKWPKMSMEQRLDVYKAKVEVEIDAQQRLLKQFGEGDPNYVRSVQHNLKNLQSRMAEVDLGVKNPKAVEDADWLKEAEVPRLFSKSAAWKWGQPNVDGIPAHPSARRPFGEIQEVLSPERIQQLRDTYPSLKKENESEVRALWHILQQKKTEKVIVGEDDIKRFFGLSTRQKGINMVDDLQITKDGKLIPIEVKNTKWIDFGADSNAALKKFESIANRVDMKDIDHFEIICHSMSRLGDGFRVDKSGMLSKLILDTNPPQWEMVKYGGKSVYVRYGDLGEISK